jgi:chromosome partitioning protein
MMLTKFTPSPAAHPYIISLASAKGGVGKSTLCMNLAHLYAEKGLAVTIADACPQQSIMLWGRLRSSGRCKLTTIEAISLFHKQMSASELKRLKADVVIIDHSSFHGTSEFTALSVSDLVIVPSRMSALDLEGCRPTIDRLAKNKISYICVLTMMTKEKKYMFTPLRHELEGDGVNVAPIAIPYSEKIVDATAYGETIFDYSAEDIAGTELRWLHNYLESWFLQRKI